MSACCGSGTVGCTNTWPSFVGKHNWGWRSVDTSSCLQGWNKDLTPAAVQHRHQLGLEPEKMSFTSSINTAILSPSQPQMSLTFFCLLWLFPYLPLALLLLTPMHHSSASAQVPFSIPPSQLCLVALPLANPFQWHNIDFLPTFLPSFDISLSGTVALDFCDDFICLSQLGWWSTEAENKGSWESQVLSFTRSAKDATVG